jgi:hypothetical protein
MSNGVFLQDHNKRRGNRLNYSIRSLYASTHIRLALDTSFHIHLLTPVFTSCRRANLTSGNPLQQ